MCVCNGGLGESRFRRLALDNLNGQKKNALAKPWREGENQPGQIEGQVRIRYEGEKMDITQPAAVSEKGGCAWQHTRAIARRVRPWRSTGARSGKIQVPREGIW